MVTNGTKTRITLAACALLAIAVFSLWALMSGSRKPEIRSAADLARAEAHSTPLSKMSDYRLRLELYEGENRVELLPEERHSIDVTFGPHFLSLNSMGDPGVMEAELPERAVLFAKAENHGRLDGVTGTLRGSNIESIIVRRSEPYQVSLLEGKILSGRIKVVVCRESAGFMVMDSESVPQVGKRLAFQLRPHDSPKCPEWESRSVQTDSTGFCQLRGIRRPFVIHAIEDEDSDLTYALDGMPLPAVITSDGVMTLRLITLGELPVRVESPLLASAIAVEASVGSLLFQVAPTSQPVGPLRKPWEFRGMDLRQRIVEEIRQSQGMILSGLPPATYLLTFGSSKLGFQQATVEIRGSRLHESLVWRSIEVPVESPQQVAVRDESGTAIAGLLVRCRMGHEMMEWARRQHVAVSSQPSVDSGAHTSIVGPNGLATVLPSLWIGEESTLFATDGRVYHFTVRITDGVLRVGSSPSDASCRIRVQCPNGHVIPGVFVNITTINAGSGDTIRLHPNEMELTDVYKTDAKGEVEFIGILPGSYCLSGAKLRAGWESDLRISKFEVDRSSVGYLTLGKSASRAITMVYRGGARNTGGTSGSSCCEHGH